MSKKRIFAIASLIAVTHAAFAQVDVNKADRAMLDSVSGLGPSATRSILKERNEHGEFRNWADFLSRVKGIGDKRSGKLSDAGLTVNGQSMPRTAFADMQKENGNSTPAAERGAHRTRSGDSD